MTTASQLRAARAMVGLSQSDLAERCGVSTMTIKRAEGTGSPTPSPEIISRIRAALEAAGVEFVEASDGGGTGVRFSINAFFANGARHKTFAD